MDAGYCDTDVRLARQVRRPSERSARLPHLLTDQLRLMAQHFPDEGAYVDVTADRRITFAEWDRESDRLARGLLEAGAARGDRVAIYLPAEEALEWITAYAAVHKAG
ncbi:MAG: AMP-binding protein, partial [Acidimicrobiales bacterium]